MGIHVYKKYKQDEANKKSKKCNKGFISDEPIPVRKEEQKQIENKGYTEYAKNIADKIIDSKFDKAFAIGVNGKWGAGKTSFSNLIRRNLDEAYREKADRASETKSKGTNTNNDKNRYKDIIEIDFKPWSSNTPDAIIKDFFETLQDELSPYHSALSRLLIRYSRKLTTINSNVITQTIEYVANYILDLDATNKVYKKIDDALRDINKKIIIYIDDLDRLEQSEIMEVIRLIRNTANFYNTFFIVTYDKDYVNKALKDAGIDKHEKFMEKIFQLEVNLPYYKKYELIKELCDKLKELFPDKLTEDIEKEVFKESHKHHSNILDDWLGNSRDVTRLCNSLMLNYPRVKDYVVFKEFLFIEILRLNYPSVYFDLYNQRKYFFEEKSNTGKFEFKGAPRLTINSIGDKDVVEAKPLSEYIELNYQYEKDKIHGLLDDIFYEFQLDKSTTNQNNHQDSIVRTNRFYIYFNYTNFDSVLSFDEFNTAYNKTEEEFFEKIREWVDKELGLEVSERLGNINDFKTKDDLEKYARGLILFYDLFKSDKTLDYFKYKINNKELIKEYYNDSSEKTIESIFQPFSKNDIRRKLEFIESFDKEEIVIFQNTFLILFETLIENSNKFNYEMSDCVRIAYKIPEIKDPTIERIKKFILENDHLQGFLLSTLCPSCSKNHIFKGAIEDIFPDLIEFEELLLSRKEQSGYVKEYLGLYNKCKHHKFNKEFKFDFPFHHLPTIKEWKKGL